MTKILTISAKPEPKIIVNGFSVPTIDFDGNTLILKPSVSLPVCAWKELRP